MMASQHSLAGFYSSKRAGNIFTSNNFALWSSFFGVWAIRIARIYRGQIGIILGTASVIQSTKEVETLVTYIMQSKLSNSRAAEFYDFMIDPPPEVYKNWLPEEHFKFHLINRSDNSPVDDLLYFDQNIGHKYRLKFYGIIKKTIKPDHIAFQLRKFGMNLPGYLELDFLDTDEGLVLTETLRIGLNGPGKILDPIIKMIAKGFIKELTEHHKREWQNLSDILSS